MISRITQEMLAKIERICQESLDARFGDDGLEFGPIIAIPRIDHYGDEYVHVFIAFEGDQDKLDPRWTIGMTDLILSHFERGEVPGFPLRSFIGRDEWEEDNMEEYIYGRAEWIHTI